ncbi:hypothetical protein BDW22DRAFT_524585 [Trametopsis cervina]|nr:hypothetical protein BDW22DRAFT_524585 [Trametopsis cervina]
MSTLLVLSLLLLSTEVSSTTVNVTIDDIAGDEINGLLPVYSPSASWFELFDRDAATFFDSNALHRGSVHIGGGSLVVPAKVSLRFNGTSIQVFNVVQNNVTTAFEFELDGLPTEEVIARPQGDSAYTYNYNTFSRVALPAGEHTLSFSGSHNIFDYAIYSTDDTFLPLHTPVNTDFRAEVQSAASAKIILTTRDDEGFFSSPVHRDVLVVALVAGILVLLVLGVFIHIWLRRRCMRQDVLKVEPFVLVPSPMSQFLLSQADSVPDSAAPIMQRFSFEHDKDPGSSCTASTGPGVLPSSVEDIYTQLEVLSTEVQSIRRRDSSVHPKEVEARGQSESMRRVQEAVENLRVDIHRLKYGEANSDDSHQTSTGPLRPLELLRDLALLKAEIDDVLVQQHVGSSLSMERLPSYKTIECRRQPRKPVPPLPPLPDVSSASTSWLVPQRFCDVSEDRGLQP